MFEGLGGNDTVTGNGDTEVRYSQAMAGVTVNLQIGMGYSTADVGMDGGADDLAGVGVDTFVSGVTLARGSEFDDVIVGSDGAAQEALTGRAGNDFIDGGGGTRDRADYFSDAGAVTVDLTGQDGPAGQGTALDGFGGTDTLQNIEEVRGSAFDDTITGDSQDNLLAGVEGADTLNGGGGDDLLAGGEGGDVLNGGAGSDTASYARAGSRVDARLINGQGFAGNAAGDTYNSIENLTGSAFNDLLVGNNAANILSGLAGNDSLNALAGNDTLSGGDGNDLLTGGTGGDVLNGGAGRDTANYSNANGRVDARLLNGRGFAGDAAGDTYDSIENLFGSNFNDLLVGNNAGNTLIGRGGNDNLNALGGNDALNGGGGNDLLTGGTGADVLVGGGGIDTANYSTAGARVDARLFNGRGFAGESAGDRYNGIENLSGSNFNDLLVGNNAGNTLIGRGGNDNLNALGGNDALNGGGGNDLLTGGAGADVLVGGGGLDTANYSTAGARVDARLLNGKGFAGDALNDRYSGVENLNGSNFNDVLVGDNAANRLSGLNGNDLLNALGGNDVLAGGAGNDRLFAGAGNDVLVGQAGNDLLLGDRGNDLLVGGGGNDLFLFRTGDGADRISGFEGGAGIGDRILIRNGATLPNDFQDILVTATQVGAHTVIDLGGGDQITLLGVNVGDLAADDFLF